MQVKIETKNLPRVEGARICILQAEWYKEYTDKMIQKYSDILEELGASVLQRHILPGSLELPLAALRVSKQNPKPDAIVCFGALMKGETFHFEMILNACTEGLTRVMLEQDIPIIIEVIPVSSVEQLVARSADDDYNKGLEAAVATAKTIAWRRENP